MDLGPFSVEITYQIDRTNQETIAILFGYLGPMLENGCYYSTSIINKEES